MSLGESILLSGLAIALLTCHPSNVYHFEFQNTTDVPIRVVVPELDSTDDASAWREKPGINWTLAGRERWTWTLHVPPGNRAGHVWAYAGSRLIFCSKVTDLPHAFQHFIVMEIIPDEFDPDCGKYSRPLVATPTPTRPPITEITSQR